MLMLSRHSMISSLMEWWGKLSTAQAQPAHDETLDCQLVAGSFS